MEFIKTVNASDKISSKTKILLIELFMNNKTNDFLPVFNFTNKDYILIHKKCDTGLGELQFIVKNNEIIYTINQHISDLYTSLIINKVPKPFIYDILIYIIDKCLLKDNYIIKYLDINAYGYVFLYNDTEFIEINMIKTKFNHINLKTKPQIFEILKCNGDIDQKLWFIHKYLIGGFNFSLKDIDLLTFHGTRLIITYKNKDVLKAAMEDNRYYLHGENIINGKIENFHIDNYISTMKEAEEKISKQNGEEEKKEEKKEEVKSEPVSNTYDIPTAEERRKITVDRFQCKVACAIRQSSTDFALVEKEASTCCQVWLTNFVKEYNYKLTNDDNNYKISWQ